MRPRIRTHSRHRRQIQNRWPNVFAVEVYAVTVQQVGSEFEHASEVEMPTRSLRLDVEPRQLDRREEGDHAIPKMAVGGARGRIKNDRPCGLSRTISPKQFRKSYCPRAGLILDVRAPVENQDAASRVGPFEDVLDFKDVMKQDATRTLADD